LAGFYTYEGHIQIQRNLNWHEKNFNFISVCSNPRMNQRLSDVESVSINLNNNIGLVEIYKNFNVIILLQEHIF